MDGSFFLPWYQPWYWFLKTSRVPVKNIGFEKPAPQILYGREGSKSPRYCSIWTGVVLFNSCGSSLLPVDNVILKVIKKFFG